MWIQCREARQPNQTDGQLTVECGGSNVVGNEGKDMHFKHSESRLGEIYNQVVMSKVKGKSFE